MWPVLLSLLEGSVVEENTADIIPENNLNSTIETGTQYRR